MRSPDRFAQEPWSRRTRPKSSRTIQVGCATSRSLRHHNRASAAVTKVVEMPDALAVRVIRSLRANPGASSKALAKEAPALAQAGVSRTLAQAVQQAFSE